MHKCNLCLYFSCQIGYRVESWWILARSPKVSSINDVFSFFYLFGPLPPPFNYYFTIHHFFFKSSFSCALYVEWGFMWTFWKTKRNARNTFSMHFHFGIVWIPIFSVLDPTPKFYGRSRRFKTYGYGYGGRSLRPFLWPKVLLVFFFFQKAEMYSSFHRCHFRWN